MRKLLAFSTLLLLAGAATPALAKDARTMVADASQWRAERVNVCADRKYQCLQYAVGILASQRGQCLIRYDQCMNR